MLYTFRGVELHNEKGHTPSDVWSMAMQDFSAERSELLLRGVDYQTVLAPFDKVKARAIVLVKEFSRITKAISG